MRRAGHERQRRETNSQSEPSMQYIKHTTHYRSSSARDRSPKNENMYEFLSAVEREEDI